MQSFIEISNEKNQGPKEYRQEILKLKKQAPKKNSKAQKASSKGIQIQTTNTRLQRKFQTPSFNIQFIF
jgi:hypothetical protein